MPCPEYYNSNLYPDGSFSMGYVKPKKITQKEKARDKLSEMQDKIHYWQEYWERDTEYYHSITEHRDWNELPERLKQEAGYSLGLSPVANSHKPNEKRSRRGLKGINSSQRYQVRSGAYLLQRRWGRKLLSFCTFTLPSLSLDSLKKLVSCGGGWPELVRKFLQELSRALKRRGGDGILIGCSEFQEKRFLRTGGVAPHLHLVFKGASRPYAFYLSADELRSLWRRCILNHLRKNDIDEELDARASVDCQVVKKDVVGYLGKYMSKGGTLIKAIKEAHGESCIPTGWVHLSLRMRRYIKLHTSFLSEGIKTAILERIPLVERKYCLFLVEIKIIGNDSEEFVIGYAGKLSKNEYKLIPFEYDYYMSWGLSVFSISDEYIDINLLKDAEAIPSFSF